jgi:hypothetical protein
LLNRYTVKSRIEGSNPSVSANTTSYTRDFWLNFESTPGFILRIARPGAVLGLVGSFWASHAGNRVRNPYGAPLFRQMN